MKAILFGTAMTLLAILTAIFTGDGTASVIIAPMGIGMIYEGIKNGDAIWEEET